MLGETRQSQGDILLLQAKLTQDWNKSEEWLPVLGLGWGMLTGKGHEDTFWSDTNVLYFDWSGYTDVSICQYPSNVLLNLRILLLYKSYLKENGGSTCYVPDNTEVTIINNGK